MNATPAAARRAALLLVALVAAGCASGVGRAADGDGGGYLALVASESVDEVARVRFGADGVAVVSRLRVGTNPVEMEGPHGVAVAPDGRFYYVTISHGTPYGSLWKIDAATDAVVGRTTLGHFPATVDVTPDGEYAFVSNFNLHGDHVPSSISKVHLPTMTEVARTQTCVMPHGSRVNRQGTRHYSVCMMDEVLVELNVATGAVARTFSVAPGREGPGHGAHVRTTGAPGCSPTWAQPDASGSRVYVACNRSGEILEVDAASWSITRRFPAGEAPYNLAVTPDGRLLLATLKNRSSPGVQVIELATGRTAATIPASGVLPHGVAVTPDSRYAVVSVEGIGSEPGRVDVIDLQALRVIGTAEVGQQAGGIAVGPR